MLLKKECQGFLPKRGQNEIVGIIGGLVCICVQSMWQTRRGLGACSPGKFLILGSFIRHTLVESGTVFAQT